MSKKLIFFLLFCIFSSNVLAEEKAAKFNFDEDYQGEETLSQTNAEKLVYDPLEVINRPIFQFNEGVDKYFLLPITRQYKKYTPDRVRESVHNFINNISAPFSVINSLLQGDGTNAMASFSSFLINTTVGLGGLFDFAGTKKITYNREDLGQTLGVYGLGSGPYLVVPFIGPNDLRDFSGLATTAAVSPIAFNYLEIGGKRELIDASITVSINAADALDIRTGLIDIVDDMRKNSFDLYATARSAYLQRREALITNK